MDRIRDVLRESLALSLSAVPPLDRLAAAWLVSCGRTLAERGTIVDYDNGALRVEVCDSAWMEQMRSMRDQLRSELTRIAGVKVTEIHFVLKRQERR